MGRVGGRGGRGNYVNTYMKFSKTLKYLTVLKSISINSTFQVHIISLTFLMVLFQNSISGKCAWIVNIDTKHTLFIVI